MHSDGVDRGEISMNEQRLGELMLEIERTYARTPNPSGSGMLRPPLPCDVVRKRKDDAADYERSQRYIRRKNVFDQIIRHYDDDEVFDCLDVSHAIYLHQNAAANYLNRMVLEGYLIKQPKPDPKQSSLYKKTGKQLSSFDLIGNSKSWT